MRRSVLVLIIILTGSLLIFPGELKKLTFEQVYMGKGEKLLKPLPMIRGWADNINYYQMKDQKLFKVDARNGKAQLVMDGMQYKGLFKKGFNLMRPKDKTNDYSQFLFIKKGDIFLFNTKAKQKEPVRLTETDGVEENPTFSPNSTKIAYTKNGNLYVYDLQAKEGKQLTEDGSEEILNGYASWVYMEEILGRRGGYNAFWWSPDGTKLVFIRFDQSKVPIFPIFRATSTYGDLEKQRYPKPGYPNPEVKIGIVDVITGNVEWVPFEDPGEHYLAFPKWNKKSSAFYFQWMNRDQNHLKVLRYDLAAKTVKTAYEEKQKAWIDFLGGDDLFILGNEDLVLRSSKSGWYHIYYVSRKGDIRPITSGDWTVNGIERINERKKQIYFTARKEDSTETDYYGTGFDGKRIKRLTTEKGSHRVTVSPDGGYFIDEYSAIHTPPKMELRNRTGKRVRTLGDRYSPVFDTYQLAKAELFRIKTGDGYELPALWLLPPGFDKDKDKNKKYPVVIAIYGGPGASTVRNAFPAYYGRLNRHFLAQQGIIVLAVDHRGSGHFGKKGMDLMHRNLGKWEMHDYIETVKYLRTLPFVDSQKIGITGGSYGGYVTALALTYGADYFNFGIAGSSVIDWSLYDSVYVERYMDTPKDNPEGYKESSVLKYIDKYKDGSLLITHGTMDDNVHMQNTIQFMDKALDAGKFVELMLFPGERHGFRKKRMAGTKISLDFWLRKFYGKSFKK